ncbi:molecular chaperone [Erwinia mallotivora]|uniref:fimbrial biogenesis chaperone n=1 Tax=Erwinia mallotivora TaxID=69222 RepID=UPI0021C12D51|nr:molecular chaperone [Erwinia mallotivora]
MRYVHIFLLSVVVSVTGRVNAGVIIGGSRLVYESSKKEKSISVENPDKSPFLIQSWIEDAEGNNIRQASPFIITPPLFRLDDGQKNLLRIVRTTTQLPQDKESLFWLNIKSIPSKSANDKNTLQIAIRSRLKLFYRPEMLKDSSPEDYGNKLLWQAQNGQLKVTNPSSYFMNFLFIKINDHKIIDGGLIAPLSSATFKLPDHIQSGDISWKLINDYGGTGQLHHSRI